jgi:hypothetical protein
MSDISPYGVTQNPDENAITANEMVGERAGLMTGDQLAGVSAAMFSTAPYRGGPKVTTAPPLKMRHRDGVPLCIARNNTCQSWRLRGSEYCRWHEPGKRREPPAAT